ncbi:hypothetical protein N3K66_007671 [Trichothecium roseum]|uniref:Uncharacterized protein n=1 Tax=Trichothecium roseum TaxID=47278 RepID=A0ACC0UUL8_9HYPO|nr:hypothetical protein N3K66_007671 [Trichothecium roseum]
MKRLISTPASRPRTAPGKSFWPTPCPARKHSHRGTDAKKANDLTLQMRRRAPLKTIPDTLHPTPCLQFTSLLDDLIPGLAHHHRHSNSGGNSGRQAPVVLPQGAHLVYFPPLQPASLLAPDGADADHVPPDFGPLAPTWHGSTGGNGGGRRLWAGGEVIFRDGWQREAVADGRAWMCREEIAGARALGGGRRIVDVVRRYGPGGVAFVEERRTLAFVPGPGAGAEAAGEEMPRTKMMKPTLTATRRHILTPTPAHLFHFSALTYNAHFIHLHPAAALVHGPLLLALMLRVLTSGPPSSSSFSSSSSSSSFEDVSDAPARQGQGRSVRSIAYRNLAPLYVGRPLTVCVREDGGEKVDVWVEGDEGGVAVKGRAVMI